MTDEMGLSGEDLIDIDRYPLHALDSDEGERLVARCRHALEDKALCLLPGFVRSEALAEMVSETTPLTRVAHYLDETNFFSHDREADKKWPAGHPNRAKIPNCYRQVLTEDVPENSRLYALSRWSPLTEFVRRVFTAETMYRSNCPHLSLTLKIADTGDADGWHYDPNDGVVSLLLQKPDNGGQFEYTPYIRSPDDERYDDVAKLFADPQAYALRPSMEPGTFVLFNGHLSMHRVTTVGETTQPRMIALLSYDKTPDQVFSPWYVEHVREFPTDADLTT